MNCSFELGLAFLTGAYAVASIWAGTALARKWTRHVP